MSDATAIAVDREVVVRARPETVFEFFTDSQLLSAWFGPGSTVEPTVGGPIVIRFPGGQATARGEILELDPPRRVVFSWGYDDNDDLPPGASKVEVTLEPSDDGTLVSLHHRLSAETLAAAHVAGWRHHLGHLATLSSRRQHLDATVLADRWFALWHVQAEPRAEAMSTLCADDLHLIDDLVTVEGAAEASAHIENARAHLTGCELSRRGTARIVGDHLFTDWRLCHESLGEVGEGRLVAKLDVDSRIVEVVSSWTVEPDEVVRRLMAGVAHVGDVDAEPDMEPHLWVTELPAAVDWYQRVLGFVEEARHPEGDEATFFRLRLGRAGVMLAIVPPDRQASGNQSYLKAVTDRMSHGGPLALYLPVDDVDAAHRRAVEAGAEVIEELWDPWWGGRQFTVVGPDEVWWTVTAR